MMTLEEIRNIEFNRGRGYRADEVDDFIDECVETIENLEKENISINQKMKALADKLAEYRNDEDSIRAALLSAQRTGDTIIRDAEQKAKAMLENAQQNADTARRKLLADVENERNELTRVKREVAEFKNKLLQLYQEQLALIKVLPEDELAEQSAPADQPIVSHLVAEEDDDDMIVVAPNTDEEPVRTNEEEELKPLSRFADLKFGNDYDIRQDDDEEELDDDEKPSRGLFRKKK